MATCGKSLDIEGLAGLRAVAGQLNGSQDFFFDEFAGACAVAWLRPQERCMADNDNGAKSDTVSFLDMANAIRALSMDAVQQANSGHQVRGDVGGAAVGGTG